MYNLIPSGTFKSLTKVGSQIDLITDSHIKVDKNSSGTAQFQFFVRNVVPGTEFKIKVLARKISGRPSIALNALDDGGSFTIGIGSTSAANLKVITNEDWQLIELGFVVDAPNSNVVRIAFGALSADNAVGEFKDPHISVINQTRSRGDWGPRVICAGTAGFEDSDWQLWDRGINHNIKELIWNTGDKTLDVFYEIQSDSDLADPLPLVLTTPYSRGDTGESPYTIVVVSQGSQRFKLQFYDAAGLVIDVPNDISFNFYFNLVVLA